jgi:hypothetical protein
MKRRIFTFRPRWQFSVGDRCLPETMVVYFDVQRSGMSGGLSGLTL